MAGLSTFTPVRKTVMVTGADGEHAVSVRGLSITDIGVLLDSHGDELNGLTKKHQDEGTDVGDVQKIVQSLLTDAPTAAAAIIATAADEPDSIDAVLGMAAMDQIKLLIEIAALTFQSEEALGNALVAFIGGMKAVTAAVEKMDPRLELAR